MERPGRLQLSVRTSTNKSVLPALQGIRTKDINSSRSVLPGLRNMRAAGQVARCSHALAVQLRASIMALWHHGIMASWHHGVHVQVSGGIGQAASPTPRIHIMYFPGRSRTDGCRKSVPHSTS